MHFVRTDLNLEKVVAGQRLVCRFDRESGLRRIKGYPGRKRLTVDRGYVELHRSKRYLRRY
jgi:hypothetical protein